MPHSSFHLLTHSSGCSSIKRSLFPTFSPHSSHAQMMPTLIVGASGATGKRLVQELLDDGHEVRVLVRRRGQGGPVHTNLEEIVGEIGSLSAEVLQEHAKGCGAVVLCLGHNLTPPLTYKLCAAVSTNEPPSHVKCVLTNMGPAPWTFRSHCNGLQSECIPYPAEGTRSVW